MKDKKKIGFWISYISKQAQRYFNESFSKIGLNRGSVYILKKLYDEDGINQNALSNSIHLDKANITRALNKLSDQGFIVKIQDREDKRAKLIFLTEKAHQMKTEFFRIYKNWNDILMEGIEPDKQKMLYDLILHISENTNNYLGDKNGK